MTLEHAQPALAPARDDHSRLRRELDRFDTVFFLISAMVVVDTIGAIAIGGAQAFTWLFVLLIAFFVPSALASAELGAAIPQEGGAYVWVRMAFGRFAGALTSLFYWAGTPMWLGGSVTVLAIAVVERTFGPSRVAGGLGVAWLVSILATGWSLLVTLCLLWPGFGTADPIAALPAGFEGQRLQFELLVLTPVAFVAVLACLFYRLGAAGAS